MRLSVLPKSKKSDLSFSLKLQAKLRVFFIVLSAVFFFIEPDPYFLVERLNSFDKQQCISLDIVNGLKGLILIDWSALVNCLVLALELLVQERLHSFVYVSVHHREGSFFFVHDHRLNLDVLAKLEVARDHFFPLLLLFFLLLVPLGIQNFELVLHD